MCYEFHCYKHTDAETFCSRNKSLKFIQLFKNGFSIARGKRNIINGKRALEEQCKKSTHKSTIIVINPNFCALSTLYCNRDAVAEK